MPTAIDNCRYERVRLFLNFILLSQYFHKYCPKFLPLWATEYSPRRPCLWKFSWGVWEGREWQGRWCWVARRSLVSPCRVLPTQPRRSHSGVGTASLDQCVTDICYLTWRIEIDSCQNWAKILRNKIYYNDASLWHYIGSFFCPKRVLLINKFECWTLTTLGRKLILWRAFHPVL